MIMKKLEDSYFQKLPKIFATTSLEAINKLEIALRRLTNLNRWNNIAVSPSPVTFVSGNYLFPSSSRISHPWDFSRSSFFSLSRDGLGAAMKAEFEVEVERRWVIVSELRWGRRRVMLVGCLRGGELPVRRRGWGRRRLSLTSATVVCGWRMRRRLSRAWRRGIPLEDIYLILITRRG